MDWASVFGALGTMLVLVIGALGAWYLKILAARHSHALEQRAADEKREKAEAAEKRRDKKEASQELWEVLEATKEEVKESREQIHDLRNRLQVAEGKETACQIRLARSETIQSELQARVDDMGAYIEDMEDALAKATPPIHVTRRRRAPGSHPHKPLPPEASNG